MISVRSIAKQLLGAALGALAALVLYGAYSVVAPRVAAMLPDRAESKHVYTERERRENQDKIVRLAQERLRLGVGE